MRLQKLRTAHTHRMHTHTHRIAHIYRTSKSKTVGANKANRYKRQTLVLHSQLLNFNIICRSVLMINSVSWLKRAQVATQNRVIYSNGVVFDCQQENKMKWNDINMRSNMNEHSHAHSCMHIWSGGSKCSSEIWSIGNWEKQEYNLWYFVLVLWSVFSICHSNIWKTVCEKSDFLKNSN